MGQFSLVELQTFRVCGPFARLSVDYEHTRDLGKLGEDDLVFVFNTSHYTVREQISVSFVVLALVQPLKVCRKDISHNSDLAAPLQVGVAALYSSLNNGIIANNARAVHDSCLRCVDIEAEVVGASIIILDLGVGHRRTSGPHAPSRGSCRRSSLIPIRSTGRPIAVLWRSINTKGQCS